jgi:hypothetical protein
MRADGKLQQLLTALGAALANVVSRSCIAAASMQSNQGTPIRQYVKQACQTVAKICHFSTPAVASEPLHH